MTVDKEILAFASMTAKLIIHKYRDHFTDGESDARLHGHDGR